MAKTVLVTGATGFIGQLLVRTLLAQGDRVRCLVRKLHPSLPPDAESVLGDVTHPETLPRAVAGVDLVYHLAGATLVRHPVEYRRVNAWGTRNLAQACAQISSPPVVVYLSSLAAAGPSPPDRPREEGDSPAPVSHYGRSKLAGERALASLAPRLQATVIRAAGVLGPGDTNALRLFKAAQLGLNGVPGSADVRLAMIHVEDVIRCLMAAAERGERLSLDSSQGVYFAAMPEQPTLQELGRLAGEAVGQKVVRTVGLPRSFCWLWGHVIDLWIAVTGQVRLLMKDKMREALAGSWICSTDKARRELGFQCDVTLVEAFTRTVAWYRAKGWL